MPAKRDAMTEPNIIPFRQGPRLGKALHGVYCLDENRTAVWMASASKEVPGEPLLIYETKREAEEAANALLRENGIPCFVAILNHR